MSREGNLYQMPDIMYQCINVHTAQLKLVKPQGSNNIFWQYLMGKGAAATLIFLLIFPPEEEID